MAKINTLVLRAPGTNCDQETVFAFQRAGSEVDLLHINELISRRRKLADYQILVIPGGFTYGDDISAGRVLANELKIKLGDDVRRFIEKGGLLLGICNGFQVLAKAGFLPGRDSALLTLANNDSGRFECRWVYLGVNKNSPCVFTQNIDRMYLPVAHGEGKVVTDLNSLPCDSIAVYYTDAAGNITDKYPDNPNGSMGSIAGVCDSSGRVFALMPHPERHILGTQHPRWTREGIREQGDGFPVFVNAVKWARSI